MTLLNDIQQRSEEILNTKAVIKQYENELDKLDNEIAELERRTENELSFELDKQLNEKKEFRPKAQHRLDKAKQKLGEDIKVKARAIAPYVTRYAKEQFKEDDMIQEKYEQAQASLLDAYKQVIEYEDARKDRAKQIMADLDKAKYNEAISKTSIVGISHISEILSKSELLLNLDMQGYNGHPSMRKWFELVEEQANRKPVNQ
jgi:ElaB/YqjD/DUF883 family membrane-anchored ribosome-binding protein